MTSTDRAQTFDGWAGDYDRYRPGYPAALFGAIADRLALPARPRVADLGAGTGLATFAMADLGWLVTAVEPGAGMLHQLRRRAMEIGDSGVAAVLAPAEDTGLETAAFDLATAAQAFHWFDRPRAVAEMGRIVRPGGGLALFWNVRLAEASPLVADYERLIERLFGDAGIGQYLQHGPAAEDAATRDAFASTGVFVDLEREELRHEVQTDADGLIGMAFTASYVRRLPDDEQRRLREELWALLERRGAMSGPITIPYRIDLWTARRSDR